MLPDLTKHHICFTDPKRPCLDFLLLNILFKQPKNKSVGHDPSPKFYTNFIIGIRFLNLLRITLHEKNTDH